ncbi:MAG: hypothetical protein DWQ37_11055 [Planctomycetota bacterium]|nr:MAG: hypothetical protein DWQ37_11055 [Planctomycetota bacterium]
MPGDTRWIVSKRASALHAAQALIAGHTPVDPKMSEALADEASRLATELESVGLPADKFFDHAIPLSAQLDSHARLVEVTLTKTLGPRQTGGADTVLAGRLASLAARMHDAYPSGVEELELRSGPLRGQWEARGAGLLTTLRRLTEPDVVVDSAHVILVQPVLGGGGAAHRLYNSLHFEAVLTNPHPTLPEVARLGWLWAQLNLDLPKYQERLGRDRLDRIGPLAVLPPLLAAASELELAPADLAGLERALDAWFPCPDRADARGLPPGGPGIDAQTLSSWWETYLASSPPWAVALAALDQMVA